MKFIGHDYDIHPHKIVQYYLNVSVHDDTVKFKKKYCIELWRGWSRTAERTVARFCRPMHPPTRGRRKYAKFQANRPSCFETAVRREPNIGHSFSSYFEPHFRFEIHLVPVRMCLVNWLLLSVGGGRREGERRQGALCIAQSAQPIWIAGRRSDVITWKQNMNLDWKVYWERRIDIGGFLTGFMARLSLDLSMLQTP